MPIAQEPSLTFSPAADGGRSVTASGTWQVHALAEGHALKTIGATLKPLQGDASITWDLSPIESMDHIAAQLFWNAWGRSRPAKLILAPAQEEFFHRIEQVGQIDIQRSRAPRLTPAEAHAMIRASAVLNACISAGVPKETRTQSSE